MDLAYICLEPVGIECHNWQQVSTGGYITPQLAGLIISFALLLNLIVLGFKKIKQSF